GNAHRHMARFITLLGFVLLSVVAGIAAALRFTRPQLHHQFALYNRAIASTNSRPIYLSQEVANPASASSATLSQANTLELPRASTDFVGYWGGYIRSSSHRQIGR